MAQALKRTPLFSEHQAQGARMTSFAGWEMPLQYAGIIAEHLAVRARVGIFDVSHLGRLEVRGQDALAFLQRLATSDLARLAPGRARYTLFCREDGGILDDSLVYRLGDGEYLITCNAVNSDKIRDWLQGQAGPQLQVEARDRSLDLAMLALQGPLAPRHLDALGVPASAVAHQGCLRTRIAGLEAIMTRTGFTGEDGFEIMLGPDQAVALWRRLLGQGVAPCGLGARDTLRLEAGFLLYGNDMDEGVNPYEVGLGRLVHLEKGDFLGREGLSRLQREGVGRLLVGLEMVGRGVARPGHTLYHAGAPVGRVSSGTYSPSLDKNIGLGWVTPGLAQPGTSLEVDIRGKRVAARVARLPFYRRALAT